ncbi:hypothetical protein SLEP1_g2944 [Rubroshorea leprosula]|uniref:Uncharacterized protein n=1 Tax=Rubroshorea leprosula TaxID=152421 RepID=A0AAV5HPT9_9ROSI|nr:hypothetical protein SLEP1_g2944 [Rubroshorea leprosula]
MLDANEAKSAPNITQNPLAPYDAALTNMVTIEEVERPMLENVSSWSLEELFAILTGGRGYVNLEVEELRRVVLKSKDIKIEEMLEESSKKPMSEKEVAEFLNILRKNEYRAILALDYINFTDEEILDEGNGHTKALHVSISCKMMNMPHVLIDNGSALNVIPMTVLKQLKVDEFHINHCNTVICAFDGIEKVVIRKIELSMEIGPMTFNVDFFVMDIALAFNMLLGRLWIHVAGPVPLTLHHKVKYIVNGVLVTMNVGKRFGILEPIEIIQTQGTFGLGYKPKKEDWQRIRIVKAKKHLARIQEKDPQDEPMWVPHIRVTFS